MTYQEWLGLYIAGIILGIICFLTKRGDYVDFPEGTKFRWLWNSIALFLWPLFLPFSFVALIFNIFYLIGFNKGCKFIIKLFELIKIKDVTFTDRHGKLVEFK